MCALRFCDSWDHYVTADLPEKWTSVGGTCTVNATNGRRGSGSFRTVNVTAQSLGLTLDLQPSWIVGMALRFTQFTGSAITIMSLFDDATTQVDVRVNASGTVAVTRNGTVLGTSVVALSLNTYMYLEWLATIHNSAGVMTLRLNGTPILSLTGQDTQNTANATANRINIGGQTGGLHLGTLDIDDVYICDGTGAAPYNTFLGDCRVDALLPNGEGSHSAWTVSTGTTHSTLVDDNPPNDDTDYLSTLTVGARETHTLANLPVLINPVILAVQHCISARKDDVGLRQLKSVLKSGATTQAGPTTLTIASTYAYYREVWTADPATGVAWTVAGVDALEAGFDNLV